jgi:hypothetical protein
MDIRQRALADRWFFGAMGFGLALTVFIDFAPTYYLARAAAPSLAPHLQAHGAVTTAWMLLFMVQAGLVAAHRTDLHRKLGAIGLVIATALVILTLQSSVIARGLTNRLVFSAGALVMFAVFVILALWRRRDPDAHKRLMLLATLSLVAPAIARLRLPFVAHDSVGPNLAVLYFLVPAVAFDFITLRRIHPALLWGGSFFVAMLPLRWWLKEYVFA